MPFNYDLNVKTKQERHWTELIMEEQPNAWTTPAERTVLALERTISNRE